MSLRDKIKSDIVLALKTGDKLRVSVLRYLVSLIDRKELSLPLGEMDDSMMLDVLRKELKDKKESIDMFEKGGRDDLVAEVENEIEILKTYLPKEMDMEVVRLAVAESVSKNGPVFGVVMKEVMTKFRGRVDGAVVSVIVKDEIDKMNG